MKKFSLVVIGAILAFTNIDAQETKPAGEAKIEKKVEVFYFHGTRRCTTCKAVGNVSKDYLEENYAKEIESGVIVFHDINYEESENKALAKEMNITSSSLVIKTISGDESNIENITSLAFLYAIRNPEKLKKAIKKEIDSII